jgi:hypothetical protein
MSLLISFNRAASAEFSDFKMTEEEFLGLK